jgi:hypothetical protein
MVEIDEKQTYATKEKLGNHNQVCKGHHHTGGS